MAQMGDWENLIGAEYDLDTGFLGQLREGTWDEEARERLLHNLSLVILPDESVNKRLVAVLWFIPTMIGYNIDRVDSSHAQALKNTQDSVVAELLRIFGNP